MLQVYPATPHELYDLYHHVHNRERWLGSITPAGNKVAGVNLSPFTINSGNNAYGTEVKIIDTADTPLQAGAYEFDLHRIFISDVTAVTVYRVQLVYGTGTFAAALAAGQYTEIVIRVNDTSTDRMPIDVIMPQLAAGTMVWARCWNVSTAASVSFFIGLHEYFA